MFHEKQDDNDDSNGYKDTVNGSQKFVPTIMADKITVMKRTHKLVATMMTATTMPTLYILGGLGEPVSVRITQITLTTSKKQPSSHHIQPTKSP